MKEGLDKIIKLAKKLKALADRGVEGERRNAREKLDNLLREHGLLEHQISDELKVFERTTLNEGSVILERIIKSVKPNAKMIVKIIKTKILIEVELTAEEYRIIKKKYKFFWRAYNKERKALLSAFFNAHYSEFTPKQKKSEGDNQVIYKNKPSSHEEKTKSIVKKETERKEPIGGAGGVGGGEFRGNPMSQFEEQKVRGFIGYLTKLDYSKIDQMQEAENEGDIEYQNTK